MSEATFRIARKGQPQLLSVTDGVEPLLGYTPAEWLSSAVRLADRIHPHDAEIAGQLFSPAEDRGAQLFNLRIRHADGRIRCLACRTAVAESAGDGSVLELTLSATASLAYGGDAEPINLRSVMECADGGVFVKDRHHVILGANRLHSLSFADASGQPCNLAGLTDYDLYPEEEADRIYAAEQRLFAGLPMVQEELEDVDAQGRRSWTEVRKYPIRNEQGEIQGLLGIARDVTRRVLAQRELQQSREMLKLFIEHAPAALAMLDREMRYLAVSRRWLEIHDLSGEDILGRSHYDVLPEIPERWRWMHRRAMAGEAIEAAEDCFTRADGQTHWVRRQLRPWRTGDGEIGGIIVFVEDVTLQRDSEDRLHLAMSVFRHASEGILVTDAQGNILDVNDAFTRITGYSRAEVLGRNPKLLKSGHQSDEFYKRMWRELTENGTWQGEIWNRAKNGHVYAEMLTISAVPDAMGRPRQYVALFSDITSLKEQESKLERMTHFDLLTGLPNRVLLADRMHQAMAQTHRHRRSVVIACLDLDNFKAVNDGYGHISGDQVLTVVTQRMKSVLKADDTLARLGGDEFVAVMPGLDDVGSAVAALDALLRAVAEPIQVAGRSLQLSVSIGVTFFPQAEDVDADQLLRQADQAMYRAKLEGKSRYHFFDPRFDRSIRGYHEDLERIRRALEADEFVLHFQPKVNMRTGALLGVEALIRWQHPERGLLTPAEFLPVIEGHPLAMRLDEWVIHHALIQMEQWRGQGLDIPVSINIGALHLQSSGFVDQLRTLLAQHPDIPPQRLELEVLESSALRDVACVSQVIRDCTQLGVTFALDDFGTGYASLAYLKRLPVDVLKIDQTFVREMLEAPENLTILEGIIGLAGAFRRMAIAEGVETVEHGRMLLRLGCEAAQGYGIARPMPGDQLPAWLATWRPYPQWVGVAALRPGDRSLVHAAVEHRAWVAAIESFVSGARHAAPELDHLQCRFGLWLSSEDSSLLLDAPDRHPIHSLHQKVHALAAEILAMKAEGRDMQALGRLGSLHVLRDELINQLHELIDAV